MNRRAFVIGFGALLAVPLAAGAQKSGKVWRLGLLTNTPPTAAPDTMRIWKVFIDALRERGYVEGQNFAIEARYAEGRADRWPDLASELVRLKVDVILVDTTPAALAAKNASSSIPIVHCCAIDPVGAGLAASLARPGGTSPASHNSIPSYPQRASSYSRRPDLACLGWPSSGTPRIRRMPPPGGRRRTLLERQV